MSLTNLTVAPNTCTKCFRRTQNAEIGAIKCGHSPGQLPDIRVFQCGVDGIVSAKRHRRHCSYGIRARILRQLPHLSRSATAPHRLAVCYYVDRNCRRSPELNYKCSHSSTRATATTASITNAEPSSHGRNGTERNGRTRTRMHIDVRGYCVRRVECVCACRDLVAAALVAHAFLANYL